MLIVQRSCKCSLVHHDGGGSASFASFIFTHPGNKQKNTQEKDLNQDSEGRCECFAFRQTFSLPQTHDYACPDHLSAREEQPL